MIYNLDEYLASKSKKQIINLIKNRYKAEIEAFRFNFKYDDYPYNEIKRYKTKIDNNKKIMSDCSEWFYSAHLCFSFDLWDDMVVEAGLPLESHSHNAIENWE